MRSTGLASLQPRLASQPLARLDTREVDKPSWAVVVVFGLLWLALLRTSLSFRCCLDLSRSECSVSSIFPTTRSDEKGPIAGAFWVSGVFVLKSSQDHIAHAVGLRTIGA